MKNIIKQLFIFLICTILVFNTIIIETFASEDSPKDEWVIEKDVTDDMKPGNKFVHKAKNLLWYLIAQCGAITQADLLTIYDNNEWLENIDKYGVVVRNTATGELGYKFNKALTDSLLNSLKEQSKELDNGGYELIKTVPVNKVSALYFDKSVDYRSMYDLLKDNGGLMGLYYFGNYAVFYKIDSSYYYVKGTNVAFNGSVFPSVSAYKNVNLGAVTFDGYRADTAVTSWNDTDNLTKATNSSRKRNFMLNDFYSTLVNSGGGINPLARGAFIISSTGVSIPVFNTLDDLVAYSVANNLYYTTSDYTGEGREIIIDCDELEKILSGYYDGMYDMLQRLIEQNGGNALTPEQVQELADQVAESFDMLKTEINNGFEEQDKLIQANSNLLVSIRSILGDGIEELKKLHTDANGILESMLENMGLHFSDITGRLDEIFYDATGVSVLGILNENVTSVKDALGNIVDEIRNLSNSTGSPPDGFIENVYQFFTDVINNFDEIFFDDSGRNVFDVINENIKNIELPSSSPPIVDSDGNIWDFLDFVTGLGEKALDEAEKDVDDLVGTLLDVFDSCLELIKTRFPFSIPWDIVAIMAVLSAEPETPVFDIPLKLERYGIDTSVRIDFSNFSILSDISRSFLTLIWCMYLMNYTVKFTDLRSK